MSDIPPSPTKPTIEKLLAVVEHARDQYEEWEPEVGADNETSYRKVNGDLTAARAALREYVADLEVLRDAALELGSEINALAVKLEDRASCLQAENAELRRRSNLPSLVQAKRIAELEAEVSARGKIYGEMCELLHTCCQKYELGLGGENVAELVVEEIARLNRRRACYQSRSDN